MGVISYYRCDRCGYYFTIEYNCQSSDISRKIICPRCHCKDVTEMAFLTISNNELWEHYIDTYILLKMVIEIKSTMGIFKKEKE